MPMWPRLRWMRTLPSTTVAGPSHAAANQALASVHSLRHRQDHRVLARWHPAESVERANLKMRPPFIVLTEGRREAATMWARPLSWHGAWQAMTIAVAFIIAGTSCVERTGHAVG